MNIKKKQKKTKNKKSCQANSTQEICEMYESFFFFLKTEALLHDIIDRHGTSISNTDTVYYLYLLSFYLYILYKISMLEARFHWALV